MYCGPLDTISSPYYYVAYFFGRTSSVAFVVYGRRAPRLISRMHRRRKEVRKGDPLPGLREGVRDTAQFTLAGIPIDQVSRTYRRNLEARVICIYP